MDNSALLEDIRVRVDNVIEDPEARVDVDTDGYYYNVRVVSELFRGKRPVARQQIIYRGLSELITSGTLHAVNITALTPDEQ